MRDERSSRRCMRGSVLYAPAFIVGILAAISVPAYQDYTVRSRVAEGLNLAGALINPRVYSPAHPNARLLQRQQIILSRMGEVSPPEETQNFKLQTSNVEFQNPDPSEACHNTRLTPTSRACQ